MKTFHIGGVHPEENKLSARQKMVQAPLPEVAVFLLNQHIGAPAKPVVEKGMTVKVGQKLAEADGFVSAAIYSSVSGTVLKLDKALDASGYSKPAIYIKVEGDDWEETIDRTDTLVSMDAFPNLTSQDIIEKIKDAGVVGMGGACFPTHIKLSPPPGSKPEWLIINAVECEPYLTCDHQLMLEKSDEILVGVELLMKAVQVGRGYIAIESNKRDAINLLREKAKAFPRIEIVPLKMKYPQGGEKQLIDAVVNRQVAAPPALPVSVGAVIQNVGTAYAVYEAVMKNKPLIDRVVTVTGKHLEHPSNMMVRIGTPMRLLIDACGGLPEDTGKVIGGGPMMGKALHDTEIPICKGSSGVLLMGSEEAKRSNPGPCIRCAKCVWACPMGLEPYLLAQGTSMEKWEMLEENMIISCIECGCCQFTCPAHRPLLDMIRVGKSTVTGIVRSRMQTKK